MPDTVCPKCHVQIRSYSLFCTSCGFRLDGVEHQRETIEPVKTNYIYWDNFKGVVQLYSFLMVASLIVGLTRHFSNSSNIEIGYWTFVTMLCVFFAGKYKMTVAYLFRIPDVNLRKMGLILLYAVLTVIFLKLYFYLLNAIGLASSETGKAELKRGWSIPATFVLISLLPGFLEELIFRGIIYTKLKDSFNVREALLIQASCFSVLHLVPTIFISHFVMGLFLGVVREKSDSLWLSIFFHAAWNGFVTYQGIYQ